MERFRIDFGGRVDRFGDGLDVGSERKEGIEDDF